MIGLLAESQSHWQKKSANPAIELRQVERLISSVFISLESPRRELYPQRGIGDLGRQVVSLIFSSERWRDRISFFLFSAPNEI
jgi:hypothetical protein